MYYSKVNLTINHDWARTKSMMKNLLALRNKVDPEEYGSSDHYNLKSLGTVSDHRCSKEWNRVAGPSINGTMPWLQNMIKTFSPLNPDEGCISYLNGVGAGHIDLPENKTALNYIFDNSDELAYTWIEYDGDKQTYSSEVGSAWLLDTQQMHGIENAGERWTLSIHFNSDYSTVCAWFKEHPELVFGDK
jgi:hypothetical protein